ncbi:MAG: hypothetical protein FWG75_06720 [Cystobacterineae bacterium]|nr:hypothetical protein [Cystobacterineae bacterium]
MRPFFIMLAFVLWSCGEDKVNITPQPVQNSPEKKVHVDRAPDNKIDELAKTIVELEDNNHSLINIPRDPFAFIQTRPALSDAENEDNLCEELLCGLEIGQLSLVAIISGDANPVAMLEDTQGTGYIVKKNNRIGKHGGRISHIYQNCLVVSEPSEELKSGVRDTTLCVKSEDMNSASVDLMSNRQVQ